MAKQLVELCYLRYCNAMIFCLPANLTLSRDLRLIHFAINEQNIAGCSHHYSETVSVAI